MAKVTGDDLKGKLDWNNQKAIFGVAYSIITTGTIIGSFRSSPDSTSTALSNALAKSLANGHATAFLLLPDGSFYKTGIGGEDDSGDKDYWDFEYCEDNEEFAKDSKATNTDVYYIAGGEYDAKFEAVRKKLKKVPVRYSELCPNVKWSSKRKENRVSSTHYIVHEMGLGWWSGQGIWIPSLANWLTWFACTGTAWKHKQFLQCNTLIEHKAAGSSLC